MPRSTRRHWIATVSTALPCLHLGAAESPAPAWKPQLEKVRTKHDLPAIGAAFVTSEGLKSLAVTGVRKAGTEVKATDEDLWHLGSNTKAMTSTLAAIAVQEGKLKWDTTLGEIFPDQKDLKDKPLAKATFTQLLSHWSGLPSNAMWGLLMMTGGDMRAQRGRALELAARTPDLPKPGEKHLYSNWGYALAGHMLEQVWDAPWEDLMRKRLFAPLGIEHAGFGATGTPGKLDQPWPHHDNGQPVLENSPILDNPPVLGPAGTVHMSLGDWARFIAEHLAGPAGKGKLLKDADAYKHLHTAPQAGEPYAYGWLAVERAWGGKVISHGGSNTMNNSVAWLAPEKGFAMIACTNSGQKGAAKALDETVGVLMQAHVKK